MDFQKFFELVTEKCNQPILIDGDKEVAITDFRELIPVYDDGQFSNSGESIFFHPELGFIRYEWSNWQPGWAAYYKVSGEQVMDMVLRLDEDHFKRFVDGLRELRKKIPTI